MEPVEPVPKIIYQINTYRKDLSWPHFDEKGSREAASEGHKIKLEHVIAILTLSLFLGKVINIMHRI